MLNRYPISVRPLLRRSLIDIQYLAIRKLNEMIVRKPYPLPKIQDIMNNRGTYKWFIKIDLSMMFYCFEHDQLIKAMCIITT